MTRLFGTDGIRGVANEDLTPDLAFRLGRELVATLQAEHGPHRMRLVIGRDTRRSGPLLEAALSAGALSAGADCYAVGVLPTPGIAVLTRRLEAHGGIVLSASHNPFEDNGIKLFSSEGTKFPDAWEAEIERRLGEPDKAQILSLDGKEAGETGVKIGLADLYDVAMVNWKDNPGELADKDIIIVNGPSEPVSSFVQLSAAVSGSHMPSGRRPNRSSKSRIPQRTCVTRSRGVHSGRIEWLYACASAEPCPEKRPALTRSASRIAAYTSGRARSIH